MFNQQVQSGHVFFYREMMLRMLTFTRQRSAAKRKIERSADHVTKPAANMRTKATARYQLYVTIAMDWRDLAVKGGSTNEAICIAACRCVF